MIKLPDGQHSMNGTIIGTVWVVEDHDDSDYQARAQSTRARRACAQSARAITGRRCPHSSGEGEDFLMGQLNFFTKTAVTPERKVEKSFPKWEINCHAEG